jgi:nucleoside-diphosphate-sugar epimerase
MEAEGSVLVTGASGFIGSHVVSELKSRGVDVVAVNHRWEDPGELASHVRGQPVDRCIHLGWYAAPADYLTSGEANLRSLRDSLELVDLLMEIGCQHLTVAGTSAEYAQSAAALCEADKVSPWSAYGACKAAFHLLLDTRHLGLPVAWGRVFNLTGPGEHPRRVVPTVTLALLHGTEVELSPCDQVRDFLDVRDVATAMVELSESRAAGTFNICSGEGIELRSLFTSLADRLGGDGLLRFGARALPPHDAPVVVGRNDRLRAATDWVRRHDHDEMLERIIQYWKDSPE